MADEVRKEVSEEKLKASAEEDPQANTADADGEDPDAGKADEEDTGAAFTPIVQLTEVAVASGEEHEDCLFEIKAKLYRFDKDGNQWKERGVGQVKLLKHKENKKIRLLMRQSRTLKICANHIVLPGAHLQEHAGNEKTWLWHAADYADGEVKEENLCMRFGSIESAQKFKTAYEEAQAAMEELLGDQSSEVAAAVDSAADVLGGLKVNEDYFAVKEKVQAEKPAPVGGDDATEISKSDVS